ncbi:hypothetical protein KUCAC02_017053, partial [Chaenocephalus aceratus]
PQCRHISIPPPLHPSSCLLISGVGGTLGDDSERSELTAIKLSEFDNHRTPYLQAINLQRQRLSAGTVYIDKHM